MTYDVILPAGGHVKDDLAAESGTDVKAMIRFGDETILARTIRVLGESGFAGRIVAIGGDAVQAEAKRLGAHGLPEASTGPENILNGLRWLRTQPNPPSKVMVVTTDLPFLTPDIIQRFVDLCPTDRAITVPLISRKEWEDRFPGSTAMFVTLGDGQWTTGCAYLLDANALESSMPQIEKVFAQRKSKIGMVKLLGPVFAYRFLRKTLTVPQIEAKIQSMLGCSGAAVRGAPPELAYDIDDLEDYAFAKKVAS
jgi:GTP:adenosylcobinamide-phosphate guanylyltransferase